MTPTERDLVTQCALQQAQDRRTGLAMRFVRRYDLVADRRPSRQAIEQMRAWVWAPSERDCEFLVSYHIDPR